MSQNNIQFINKNALHMICMILLAITLTACGGGGGGGSDPAPQNNAGPVDPVDPLPPGVDPVDPGDPMPDPVDPGDPGNQPNEQALFAATVHPVITNAAYSCVGCHDGGALGAALGAIPFAVANVTNSYSVVSGQGLVTLGSPAQSSLHQRPLTNHNCGADCATIAADVLQAINAWAAQSTAGNGGGNNGNVVASAMTNFSQVVEGSIPRADANMITHFAFAEGTGTTTVGTSNVGADMTLNLEGTEWDPQGGLINVSGKAQASLADSQKLFNLLSGGNQFSVEAWVIPENATQTGPARIVSYSVDTGRRNFTLGQQVTQYDSRVQTINSGANGSNPTLRTEDAVVTELTHLVMTYDNMSGGRKIYVNGQLAAEEALQGDMLNWQDDSVFILGNEATNNRLWQGVFKMVAIHNIALNGAQVAQNFEAGAGAITSLRFDVASILGAPGYIEMQAYEMDPFAYVFARPKLVSDVTGVQVKNMRVAVNNNVPVAAQAFRRVDMMVTQSGQEISELGALIPSDLGMNLDQFHLEFEVLGGQTGTAESIVGPTPPVPPVDVPEPDVGVRTFSQVHDTMAALTGISQGDNDVRNRYNELRDQLPPTADALGFGSAQQIAIQRLATTYCGEVVGDNNNARCRNFFNDGNCEIAAGEKDAIAGTVYDKIIGNNLVNQPERTASIAALVGIMDAENCANGCTGATGRQVLQAVCTAALASSAVTIN
ncbi:MAG: LamG domain-containing protein [Gammaproteobacteria bacterium]|nr:LamG domain-containing protein [Gammaproteobacteria bacterium]